MNCIFSTPRLFLNFFSFLVVCLTALPVSAEIWSQFRGPNGDGVVAGKDLPTEWSESRHVRWHTKLPGLGWSSPVCVENRVYLTTSVAEAGESNALAGQQQLRLICLDVVSGEILFDRELFKQSPEAPKVHGKNSHASPTPVFDDGRLYLHFGHEGTVCTDLDGAILWTNRDHPYAPTHGNGSSPIVVGDWLIMTCDGGDEPCTRALDKRSGKEVWKTPRNVPADKKFSFCTPSHFVINGQPQVISPGSNIVQSLNPQDGSVLWSVSYDGYSVVPKPVYYQGLIFICTGFGGTSLLAIDPTGRGDVTESHVRWKVKSQNIPQTGSLVGFKDAIIMASDKGIASAYDVKTGNELWKERLGGNYSASPLLHGDTIYFQSEQGEAIVMRLTSPLETIARNQLPGRIFASYAVVDNDLLIRTEEGLYRIAKQ